MQIPANTIYPRTGDRETVYLNAVVSDPNISVGDYTIYNDFLRDPTEFVRNNVLYHYPINGDRLVIGKFCSIACEIPVHQRQPHAEVPVHLSLSHLLRGVGHVCLGDHGDLGQPGGHCHRQRCLDRL